MANVFTLILTITTVITGIIWCVNRFRLIIIRRYLKRQYNQQQLNIIRTLPSNNIVVNGKPKLGWTELCASIFPILLIVFIIRSFIFEPFQIPSGSMMPTLMIGDFILVEKFVYGIKDPITQTTLIEIGHPKRGDIVVFKYPLNPTLNYIKRVVGLPGDRVIYDSVNKHLMVQASYINGQYNDTIEVPITYSELTPNDFKQSFYSMTHDRDNKNPLQITPNLITDNAVHLIQRKESLDGVIHDVLILPGKQDQTEIYYQQQGNSLAEWIVPQGKYFMMGDNRDNSADSRFWGFVPEKNLVGKATAIWLSFDKQEDQWPTGVRLSRIGSIH